MLLLILLSLVMGLSHCQHPPGPGDGPGQPQPWEQPHQEIDHELPPNVRIPESERENENEVPTDGEPIVGAVITPIFPMLGLAATGAKLKGATVLALAEAQALALKHKANMEKAIIDAKLKQDLMASQARIAGHKMIFNSAILGTADRSAGPEDAPDAIKQDIAQDMAGVRSGDDNPHPIPHQMITRLNEMFGKPVAKRENPSEMGIHGQNRKRDENLFVWSLNDFGRDSHLQQQFPGQHVPIEDFENFPGPPPSQPDLDVDPIEEDEVLTPVDELEGNRVLEHGEFSRMNERANPRHFGYFHHKPFGFHEGAGGFQAGAHGSSAAGLHGLGGGFSKFGRPTEITINNQQNTFTNAVPTSAGNANFQISQTTGQAGSSQSHSASNQGNPHSGGHGGGHSSSHSFRQANEEPTNPVLQSQGIQDEMMMIKEHMRITVPEPTQQAAVNIDDLKLQSTPESHMADHFLGMRSLMPADSGSGMANAQATKNFLEMMQKSQPTKIKDKSKFRRKRSLPLIRLAIDPNAKLNMPKTLENIGTIARNSFEDKHAPMYHVRNMIGSVKNAFLSGLRMAPQDLILPAQYRIIDTKEEMVMKPADIEAIKARAAADATAEAESRAARERDLERRREAFNPPKAYEVIKNPPKLDLYSKLNNWKNMFKSSLSKPPTKTFDESALRRRAFGLDDDNTPILGSRMNGDDVDPFDFLKTFQKVGAVVRSSIKSGQETIQHISDAAHSARKAYNTARFGAPRVLLPYARAPAVENDNKFMFVAPRFLDVDREEPFVRSSEPMLGMGEIMNAFGVANPEAKKVQKQRIIIEKTAQPKPGKMPIFQARFGESEDPTNPLLKLGKGSQFYVYAEDIDEEVEPTHELKVEEALQSLQSLRDILGPRTITEFLEDMKKDFKSMHHTQKSEEIQNLKEQLHALEMHSRMSLETPREEDDTELKNFLNDLFAEQTSKVDHNQTESVQMRCDQPQSQIRQQFEETPTTNDETVGSKLFLPANLLKPFMNQPNTEQLNEYFRENGDFEEIKEDSNQNLNNLLRMHALVAAINPQMYQEMFNQTLQINPNSTHPPGNPFNSTILAMTKSQPIGPSIAISVPDISPRNMESNPENIPEVNSEHQPIEDQLQDNNSTRKSMHFPKKLTKPFMGKLKPKHEYYYDYGYTDSY